jgi:hypothetical protein
VGARDGAPAKADSSGPDVCRATRNDNGLLVGAGRGERARLARTGGMRVSAVTTRLVEVAGAKKKRYGLAGWGGVGRFVKSRLQML